MDQALTVDTAQPADQPRNHAAQQAPRCRHIRLNGQPCAAPALRGQSLCYFHHRAEDPNTYLERWLPFPEDAASLQLALARVQRLLLMDGFEFKRANALLYSLQIACMNLKNLNAERAQPEAAEGERPQPKPVRVEKRKPDASQNGDEPSLAELLLGLLAQPEDDPDAPRPRIRNREDYQAAVEQRRSPKAALPGESATP
jgi:hypothetical protein